MLSITQAGKDWITKRLLRTQQKRSEKQRTAAVSPKCLCSIRNTSIPIAVSLRYLLSPSIPALSGLTMVSEDFTKYKRILKYFYFYKSSMGGIYFFYNQENHILKSAVCMTSEYTGKMQKSNTRQSAISQKSGFLYIRLKKRSLHPGLTRKGTWGSLQKISCSVCS